MGNVNRMRDNFKEILCRSTEVQPLLRLPNGKRTTILSHMKFRVVIAPDEDGFFVSECPALSGCVSQGKTREEAMTNIRDAIQGYLQSLEKHGEPIPALP
jgi:antitoxin HicB